jgi:hypothetical protein
LFLLANCCALLQKNLFFPLSLPAALFQAKGVGVGVKALKAQYELYTELKEAGAQV